MTRIPSFIALSNSGPPGLAAGRTHGSPPRTAPTQASSRAGRGASGFESLRRSLASDAATPWARSAIGAGLGLAATIAISFVASSLVTATVTEAASVLSRGTHRGKVRIDPAALHLRCTPSRPPQAAEPVSVLIPMRHRPDAAVAAVRAALGQRGVDHLDVVVLDDGCPQETRAALRGEFGDDPRVRLLASAPLPPGWSPLAHRSHQLAVAARGRILIFAEPCAPLGPDAAASATALLRGEQLDLAVLDAGRPAPAKLPSARGAGAGSQSHAGSGVGGMTRVPTAAELAAGSSAGTGSGEAALEAEGSAGGSAGSSAGGSIGDAERRADLGMNGASGTNETSGAARRSAAAAAAAGHAAGQPPAPQRVGRAHGGSGRVHPGRFTVAVDADVYWRVGGYRAAATDPDPLALLRTVRRASGRVAVADGRRVIPPAQLLEPLPPPDPEAEARWDSQHTGRGSLTSTARRVLAALVGARA